MALLSERASDGFRRCDMSDHYEANAHDLIGD